MCLLFESIYIEKGIARNLSFHQERMKRSGEAVFGAVDFPVLEELIRLPDSFDKTRLIKCRITYGRQIESIAYDYYSPRKISSLKLVHDDHIEYPHKFLDRSDIDALFAQKGEADDILIVKNGLITDTSIANICFYDGSRWITPSSPLLCGTMRTSLLQTGMITERQIFAEDLADFTHICLINAMLKPLLNRKMPEIKIVF